MDFLTFIVAALAVYRVSTLIVHDSIMAPIREFIWRRFPVEDFVYITDDDESVVDVDGSFRIKAWPFVRDVYFDYQSEGKYYWGVRKPTKVGELIECIFCTSVWVAAAATALFVGYNELPTVFEFLLYTFGLAGAVEIFSLKLGR